MLELPRTFVAFSLLLLCLIPGFLAIDSGAAPAKPGSRILSPKVLRQAQRREIEVRNNYPEFFPGKRDGSTGTPTSGGCQYRKKRRRDLNNWTDQLLTVDEMAMFLLGGGEFISPNGTVYHDSEFVQEQERSKKASGSNSSMRRWAKDMFGDPIMYITIPAYATWKKTLDPDTLVSITARTTIRAKDIAELEQTLLAHPDFKEFEVGGARVTKRWLEAAIKFSA
ncbi:hypothetical protein GYMLUDRAFT_69704 [Collybiopsis luxurians FD-317 M1]|nr:hypothetical protein GYMLUDRAFT_69704 [Collybiopsis luxurians FD-317 M1]